MYVTCLANMVHMNVLVALQIEVRSLRTRKQHPCGIYTLLYQIFGLLSIHIAGNEHKKRQPAQVGVFLY